MPVHVKVQATIYTIVLFQRAGYKVVADPPFLFTAGTEKQAVYDLKRYVSETGDLTDAGHFALSRFGAAETYAEIEEWFSLYYTYYDVAMHHANVDLTA